MLAAEPIITEFLASNSDGLLDGNGVSSDWIEIYNAGDTTIDLNGWRLTDDAGDLSKWQFPDVVESILDPGEYLVVFASGDGVPDPEGNLHTNFRLSAAGEYVALVDPGFAVASEFGIGGVDYPDQFTDVSYGFEGVSPPTATPGAILYIDADEEPGGNTTGLPGGWAPRGAGAGQDPVNFGNEGGTLQAWGAVGELAVSVPGLNPNLVYDVFAFFWDDSNGWNVEAGLTSGQLTNFVPSSPGVFAVDAFTQQPGSSQLVSGLNVLGQGGDDYSDWVDGNRTLYAAPIGQVSGAASTTVFIDHDQSLPNRTFFDGVGIRPTGALIDATSPASYLIPTDDSLGTSWTANGFDASANGFVSGQSAIGYEQNPVNNDDSFSDSILTAVPAGTTSVYLRTEFEIQDASAVTSLMLSAQYDDGFVAYLNGVQVLSRFAPPNLSHTSTAVTPTGRSDSDSLAYESFSLAGFLSELVDGTNTLAVHALNSSSSSPDFLFSPQLTFSTEAATFDSVRYLPNPTPGSANGVGVAGFVEGVVTFSHQRGFYDAPISVSMESASADADLYFTLDGSVPAPSNPNATLYTGAILVDQTTTLRSAAFREGYEPTTVGTQTYVFLEDVLTADPLGDPQNGVTYPTNWQGGFPGDYTVDSRVVDQWDDNSPVDPNDFGIREGLTSIPTISLVLDHEDLWGVGPNGTGGIYPNATSQGASWRRPGSVEYFDPNTGEQFQYNVGIQMQGAASRDNNRLLKHSFRLVFNSEFDGPGRLNFPLFDNSEFADINTVSLKASFTDSFATRTVTDRYSPLDSTYMRDVWMRDTQIAMGNPSAGSTYVHLYINGLYWGLYWPSERVDDAFLASRLGGEREDWDIVRDFNELFRGERTAYDDMFSLADQISDASPSVANDLFQQIQGRLPSGVDDPNTDALLDVDNFIDYLVSHLYAGVEDWPSHNWYAARNRVDPGDGFKFFTWDQEISLDQLYRDRTNASNNQTPGELFQDLRNSSEFRLRFADRVQKHLFNNGAMTVEANQMRWMQRANQIEAGIIGESARWGDAREGQTITAYSTLGPFGDGHIPTGSQSVPLMTVDHWRESVEYVHDSFFANAGDLLIQRLLNDGLFVSLDAPLFSIDGESQFGDSVAAGSTLTLSGPGTVYYTLDGSDPRSTSGSAVGLPYSGDGITLDTTTVVKARTFAGGEWSPLSEAVFTTNDISIVISEINYSPYEPTASEVASIAGVQSDDFEFLEVLNTSPTDSVNLRDFAIADGVSFTFGNTTLAPGERVVIVEDQLAFETRYGSGLNVIGEWSGGLSGGGETITLLNAVGAELMSVSYGDSDPWPSVSDGAGATLVLAEPTNTPSNQLGKYYAWRGSAEFGGSPGLASAPLAGVVINEVLARTELPQIDAVELYNPTSSSIDIGGWFLSDSDSQFSKHQIALGTTIGAGQYLVLDENDFSFGLKGEGDDLYLVKPTGAGSIEFVDQVAFGATLAGESLGRVPNGSGRLTPLNSNTFGVANTSPRIDAVVISEVNYHPADPNAAATAIHPAITDNDLEFVEIHNAGVAAIDLTGWELRGESDYDIPTATNLLPGENLLLVSFDPNDASNTELTAAFRAHYGLGTEVTILGGFSGNLSNGFARVELQKPEMLGEGGVVHITADEVLYDDLAPWPEAVDGQGQSLQRLGATLYGNDSTSWYAAAPTPGAVSFLPALPGDYDGNGTVEQNDYAVWRASYGSTEVLDADGNNDGIVNAADYTIWRDHLGQTATTQVTSSSTPVTAPASSEASDSQSATSDAQEDRLRPQLAYFSQTQLGAEPQLASRNSQLTVRPRSADPERAASTDLALLLLAIGHSESGIDTTSEWESSPPSDVSEAGLEKPETLPTQKELAFESLASSVRSLP
ncbi:CotH protein [Posidoniimonas corsicana]|uniref:CotH protein n=1 Tax=Posidoniimonas corsicana TaxID=1938618 RepID=A0A5C5VFB4_9BACT|nr:lamin tail domain-containing protein [Posidoniimonas corsicana]TWT36647.1 CotH protein [Posidoniimonas corsicana]